MLKTIQTTYRDQPATASFVRHKRTQGELQVMEWMIHDQEGNPLDRFDLFRGRWETDRPFLAWIADTMSQELIASRQDVAKKLNDSK